MNLLDFMEEINNVHWDLNDLLVLLELARQEVDKPEKLQALIPRVQEKLFALGYQLTNLSKQTVILPD